MATFLIVIIYLAFICLGLPDSLLGSAWPAISIDMGVSLDAGGIVSMVITLGTIVSALLSYKLITRFGTGKVTLFSVLSTAVALIGFSISPSFIWLIVFAIPLGLGGGSVDAALNNYVALHYKPFHMSWLHCFWGVGATIGPMVMAYFIQNNNWKGGYRTVSILLFILITILFATLSLWKTNSNQAATAKSDEAKPISSGSLFGIKGLKPALIACMFYCGTEITAGLWGSSFLVHIKGLTPARAAGWVAIYYAGITIGRLFSGFITFKASSKAMIRGGQIIALAGAVLLVLPLDSVFSLAALILIGLGCAPIYPCMLHETPHRFGKENSQRIMGLQMASAYTGSTLLPPLLGFISTYASMIVYPIILVIYILGMFISSEWINKSLKEKNIAS